MNQIHTVSKSAAVAGDDKVFDLATALMERAKEEGISVSELRLQDRQILRECSYPRSDCLTPNEVQDYFSSRMPFERAEHIESCPSCTTLVELAEPTEAWFGRFFQTAIAQAEEAPPERSARDFWKPFTATIRFQLPIVAAMIVFAGYFYFTRDTLLRSLAYEAAPRIIFVAIIAALAFALSSALVALFANPKYNLVLKRCAVGANILFAVIIGAYSAKVSTNIVIAYDGVRSAESNLVGLIAEKQIRGQVYSDSLFAEGSPRFMGTVIAVRNNQEFDVYWEKQGQRRNLSTIYEGRFFHKLNGGCKVVTPEREIGTSQARSFERRFDNGESVLALVPLNSANASQIVSAEPAKTNSAPTPPT
jgi:hypothetical protein